MCIHRGKQHGWSFEDFLSRYLSPLSLSALMKPKELKTKISHACSLILSLLSLLCDCCILWRLSFLPSRSSFLFSVCLPLLSLLSSLLSVLSVLCTLSSVLSALYSQLCTLSSALCTPYSLRCSLCTPRRLLRREKNFMENKKYNEVDTEHTYAVPATTSKVKQSFTSTGPVHQPVVPIHCPIVLVY